MRYTVRAAAALLLLLPALLPAAGPEGRTPADPPNRVVIDNFTFRPAELTVKVGTKVTWVNRDDVPHTATSSAKPRLFKSGTLETDEEFSFTFTTPGTYEYFCTLHPSMTGKVIVK